MNFSFALVTGATSGIGKKISELLASQGISLILSGRNSQELAELKNKLSSFVSVETVAVDLSRLNEREKLLKLIHKRAPDLVINNAGFGLYGDALSYTVEEQLNIVEVNAKALLAITLEAARTLRSKEKRGVIVNISSAAGFDFFPGMAVYAASKAFVTNFSEAFDYEMKKFGIRILTVCPGMVSTHFQQRAGEVYQNNRWGMMTAEYVANRIWKQIQRTETVITIDRRYRLLHFLSHFIPKRWLAIAKKTIIEKKISPRPFIKIGK